MKKAEETGNFMSKRLSSQRLGSEPKIQQDNHERKPSNNY